MAKRAATSGCARLRTAVYDDAETELRLALDFWENPPNVDACQKSLHRIPLTLVCW